MISAVSCCASRGPATTCPSSSTTERWNTATGRRPGASRRSRKTIYSLIDLRGILVGCNRRYLAHLSALDGFLRRCARPRPPDQAARGGWQDRRRGFSTPSNQANSALLHALQNPSVNIAGIRRAELLPNLEMFSPARLSRQLRRLLDLGVIKRIKGTYRYYLTKAGRAATAAAERLKQATIVPAMI